MAISTINSSGLNQAGDTVFCTTSGNVGIGTSSPATKLQVQSGTSPTQPTWAASDVVIAGNSAGNASYYQSFSDTAGGIVFSTPSLRARSFLLWSEGSGNMSLQNGASGSIVFTNNGSERMRIDSSGRVTTPFQPMASVYSSDTDGFTGSVGDVVPFDQEQVDVGSNYNTSTYRFTAPVAGKYFATVWFLSRNNLSGNCIGFYKNGSQVRGRGGYVEPGSGNEVQGLQTLIIDCAANDYIDTRITQISGGDFYLGDLAGMQIYLIG